MLAQQKFTVEEWFSIIAGDERLFDQQKLPLPSQRFEELVAVHLIKLLRFFLYNKNYLGLCTPVSIVLLFFFSVRSPIVHLLVEKDS